jgi:hypothetical protein
MELKGSRTWNARANEKAARRLVSLKRLLGHLRELLALEFGFVLWDGFTAPADLAAHQLAVVLADEGVVAAMLRRPNADTFLNLWVTKRIEIRNGVIFDFLTQRPKLRTRLWVAYLASASIGFTRNSVGIFQTLASKRVRGPSDLPPSREDLYH